MTYPRTFDNQQRMITFAQNGEDILIDRVFQKKNGFFIDIGAHHPLGDSVTKYFSMVGWRGINIEPDPALIAEFAKDRPNDINLCCAVGKITGQAAFHRMPNRGLSTISLDQLALFGADSLSAAEVMQVPVRTLADICAEYVKGEIDFLKIDVEGAEGDVIAGADWKKYRPRLLVIEATKLGTSEPNCEKWEPYLLSQEYCLVFFDGINRYYLRREDEGSATQFAAPVNILDLYIPFREVQLHQELNQLRAEVQRLRSVTGILKS